MARSKRQSGRPKLSLVLKAPGWSQHARAELAELILQGAHQGLPAVFDFDNTLVCGDIGEAALAVLARSRLLTPQSMPAGLCPPYRNAKGQLVRIEACADVTEYYEALLNPTVHADKDPQPLANAYAWATQVMAGFNVQQVMRATRDAFHWRDADHPGMIEITPGKTAYPVPFFYPEMVEFVAALQRHGFDLWIVSASNVWSVRWMVLEVLNPLLRERGIQSGIQTDHVIGISTLLSDRRNRLFKDSLLIREHTGYRRLADSALKEFKLTSQLQHPVPVYSGKIAALFDCLGRNPYLVAGDSPGDLPMMSLGQHRIWIARLNKPGYQKMAARWFRRIGGSWKVLPTLASPNRGFVPRTGKLTGRGF